MAGAVGVAEQARVDAAEALLDPGDPLRGARGAVPAGIGHQGVEAGHTELRGVERVVGVHDLEELVTEPREPVRRLPGRVLPGPVRVRAGAGHDAAESAATAAANSAMDRNSHPG